MPAGRLEQAQTMAEEALTSTLTPPPAPGLAAAAPVVSAAAAPVAAAPAVRKVSEPAKPDKGGWVWGTGRRKSAVARVRVKPGTGKFLVNGRESDKYFTELRDQHSVLSPLKVTSTQGKLDVAVNVNGGGFTGQAGAVLLGLARALKGYDPALEPMLREHGMLTRDAREVERKKYGLRGARRGMQWAKR